ncbi:MAG: hypothetical protein V9G18_16300 [Albidovulum sp.]
MLIVTIDEKEYLRLGLLLEQTFPEAAIQMVSVSINPAAVARAGYFGRSDEYIFFVMIREGGVRARHCRDEWITTADEHTGGNFRWDFLRLSGERASRSRFARMLLSDLVNPELVSRSIQWASQSALDDMASN